MHYMLPWDIQGHANNIEQTTDRVARSLKKGKRWEGVIANDGGRMRGRNRGVGGNGGDK